VNDLSYVTDLSKLADKLLLLDYSNVSNVLFATQSIYFAVDAPHRNPSSPGICSLDFHCSSNGICNSETGIQKCDCNQGYLGTYCNFQGSELASLKKVTSMIIDNMHTFYTTKFEIKRFDIEVIGNMLRGLLKNPDLVDDEHFEKLLQLVELVGEASIFSHWTITKQLREVYLRGLNNLIMKLHHSYKIRRSAVDTADLGQGKSLLESGSQVYGRMLRGQERATPHRSGKAFEIGGRVQQRVLLTDSE